jgi:hypothetical protein
LASWPLTLFVMLVSGFVTYELCTEWAAAQTLFLWVPEHITAWWGVPALGGWLKGVWTLLVFPLLLWTLLGGVTLLLRGASLLTEAWRRLALPMAVVVAAGHMSKAVAKWTSWAGFLPYALRRPDGLQTAVGIAQRTLPAPSSLLSKPIVSGVGLLLILTGLILALREARLADARGYMRRGASLALIGVFFSWIVFGWR